MANFLCRMIGHKWEIVAHIRTDALREMVKEEYETFKAGEKPPPLMPPENDHLHLPIYECDRQCVRCGEYSPGIMNAVERNLRELKQKTEMDKTIVETQNKVRNMVKTIIRGE